METGPDHSQTAFTGNFGGGLKYFFTKRFALRFDLRDQVGNFKEPSAMLPAFQEELSEPAERSTIFRSQAE